MLHARNTSNIGEKKKYSSDASYQMLKAETGKIRGAEGITERRIF